MANPPASRLFASATATVVFFLLYYCEVSCCRIELPPNYSSTILPPKSHSNRSIPFTVNTTIFMSRLDEVDDLAMTYTVTMTFMFVWRDTRMRLVNEEGGDGCDEDYLIIDKNLEKRLWRPAFYIFKNIKSNVVNTYDDSAFLKVIPSQQNKIIWVLRMRTAVGCDMTFTMYPMDRQTCEFTIGSIQYSSREIIFDTTVAPVERKMKQQYRYHIEEADTGSVSHKNSLAYNKYGFNIHLQRKVTPFLLNYYFPTGQLVVISWISFFIPCHMIPGRMALLVTVLLTIVNISNSARDGAPKADKITALDAWLLACQTFVALALLEYAVLLRLRFGGKQRVRPVSNRKSLSKKINRRNYEDIDERFQDEDVELGEKCANIDRRMLILSVTFSIIFNIIYWIYCDAQ